MPRPLVYPCAHSLGKGRERKRPRSRRRLGKVANAPRVMRAWGRDARLSFSSAPLDPGATHWVGSNLGLFCLALALARRLIVMGAGGILLVSRAIFSYSRNRLGIAASSKYAALRWSRSTGGDSGENNLFPGFPDLFSRRGLERKRSLSAKTSAVAGSAKAEMIATVWRPRKPQFGESRERARKPKDAQRARRFMVRVCCALGTLAA